MGTTILRRYVLLGPIGRGGVSTVYHGFDSHSARPLAIKVITPNHADDAQREASITERLRHPSVPRIYDHGAAPLPDGSVAPYVVMELLAGVALAGRLVGGPLPWPEAVRIAATVADVLAVAHRRGVVHRDLTARNIMVTPAGIKIIDFGLATAAHPAPHPVVAARNGSAKAAAARPSPSHPKTAFARPADDVYTLGVLLYEMVTGKS